MEIAWYKLIAGFKVHLFFSHFLFSCHLLPHPHPHPIPSTTTATSFFLQRSEATQCDWEADSPAEGPPSLLTPGKGDSLKGTKTYHSRFKPWNFAGNFLGFCSKAGMIPTEHGTLAFPQHLRGQPVPLLTQISPVRTSTYPSLLEHSIKLSLPLSSATCSTFKIILRKFLKCNLSL